MRAYINLVETMLSEAHAQPSQRLLDVVKRWINGWSKSERHATTRTLWNIRDEAKRFVARRYSKLYRGMSVTDKQFKALQAGQTITVRMPRLASWSKYLLIARDYAEGADGYGILVAKSDLNPVLDITRLLPFLPNAVDEKGIPEDYIRWAFREGEVVCEHDGPMQIAPSDVRWNVHSLENH